LSAQVEFPSERRSALQRLETTIAVTHTTKVATLAEIIDLDPEGLRYIGMPPTCLPFRPVVPLELQRLSDIKASVGDLEVAKVKRKGKEEDKRRRDKELKEREREAQEKAERGREAAELSLQAAVSSTATPCLFSALESHFYQLLTTSPSHILLIFDPFFL
jgi:hypothetical protein